jgi:hypothetical protein
MSAGIDLEFIRERYANMSDKELTLFITLEGAGITADALALAQAEVKKRGLNIQLSKALDVLSEKEYTMEEIDAWCDIISSLDCPVCFSRHKALNAVKTAEVLSFFVRTFYRNRVLIGCKECLDQDIDGATNATVLLGWWGFPWVMIKSVEAIRINRESKRLNSIERDSHSDEFRNFAINNMAGIEAHKGNREELQNIIRRVK